LPACDLRHRRDHLHPADRRLAVLGAGGLPRRDDAAQRRPAEPRTRRRRRPERTQPRARAARDAGRERRRLRRRRPEALASAAARRPGARQRRRDAPDRARGAPRHRLRHDPERAERAARLRAGRLRRVGNRLPAGPARDRAGSMDVAERRHALTRRTPAVSRRLLVALGTALPLLTIFVWLCLLYGWEAWGNASPWLVTDEFERAQLSRAVAMTGHEAIRTVPHPFDTLYVYLIAPAWWIHDTTRAYGAAKAIGVATMTCAIFPSYLLARLFVPKRWAFFAAPASVLIPAFAYASMLLEEPLAYFWVALSFYLVAHALLMPRIRWIVPAVAACLIAPYVRDQLGVIIPGAFIAGFAFWFTSESGRRVSRRWKVWHWLAVVVLVVGVAGFLGVGAARPLAAWEVATAP